MLVKNQRQRSATSAYVIAVVTIGLFTGFYFIDLGDDWKMTLIDSSKDNPAFVINQIFVKVLFSIFSGVIAGQLAYHFIRVPAKPTQLTEQELQDAIKIANEKGESGIMEETDSKDDQKQF